MTQRKRGFTFAPMATHYRKDGAMQAIQPPTLSDVRRAVLSNEGHVLEPAETRRIEALIAGVPEARSTEYNGWSNYATWGVKLVLDNDEGTYTVVRSRVEELRDEAPERDVVRGGTWSEAEYVRFELADWLKDFTEELCGLGGEDEGYAEPTLMARQVIQAGLADVNWDEIAENVLSES